MKTTAAVFGLIVSLTVVGFGQTRTITNATLERHAQKRIAAEKDYRENYERMGFPSPAELERQREADMAARLELADQLRKSRLEEERLELERQRLAFEMTQFDVQRDAVEYDNGLYFGGGYFGGLGGFFGDGFGKFRPHRPFGFGGNRFGFGQRAPQVIRITPFGAQTPRAGTTRWVRRGKRR